jgi:hypothetical protein
MTDRRSNKGRGAAVGAAAALAAVGLTVVALNDSEARPVTARPAAATPSAAPTTEAPAPGLTGRVVTRSGTGEAKVVDLATGRAEQIDIDERVMHAVAARGAVALITEVTGEAPGPLYLLRTDGGLTELPRAFTAYADAEGTGFWAMIDGRGGEQVTHYAADGTVLAGPLTLPETGRFAGVHADGLLLSTAGWDEVRVWDPATERVVRTLKDARPVAVNPARFVWRELECAASCPVHWTDAALAPAGELDPGVVPRYGSLTRDGRWLALRAEETFELVVCDLTERRCVRPAGDLGEEAGLAWTADGTLLVAAYQAGRVSAWQPGWDALRPVPGTYEHVSAAVPIGA